MDYFDNCLAPESSIRHARNVDEVFNYFKQEACKNEKSFLELNVLQLQEHSTIFEAPDTSTTTTATTTSSFSFGSNIHSTKSSNEIPPPPIQPPPCRTLLHYCVDPAVDYSCTIELKWNLGSDRNFFLSPLDEVRFYATDSNVVVSQPSSDNSNSNSSNYNNISQDQNQQQCEINDNNAGSDYLLTGRKRNAVLEPVLSVSMESVVEDPRIFYVSTSSFSATSAKSTHRPVRPSFQQQQQQSSSSCSFAARQQKQQEQILQDTCVGSKFIVEYDPSPVLPNSSATRSGTIKMTIPLSVLASSFLVCIYSAELRTRIVTCYIDQESMVLSPPANYKGERDHNNNIKKDSFRQYRIPPQILPWPLKNLIDRNADSAGACYVKCRSGNFGAVRRLDVDVALNVKHLFGFNGLNNPLGPVAPGAGAGAGSSSTTQLPRPLEDVLAFRQIVERGVVVIQKINASSIDSDCGLVNPATILAPLSRAVIKAYDGAPCDAIWDKTMEYGTVHFNFSCPLPIWIMEDLYNTECDTASSSSLLLDQVFEVRVLIPQYFPIEEARQRRQTNSSKNHHLHDPRLHQENFLIHPEESVHTFQRCVLRSGPIRFHQTDETRSFAKIPLGTLQRRNVEAQRRLRQGKDGLSVLSSTSPASVPPPLPYFPETTGKHSLHLRGGPAAPGQLVTAVFDLDEKLLQQCVYCPQKKNTSATSTCAFRNESEDSTNYLYRRNETKTGSNIANPRHQADPNSADAAFNEYLSGTQTHDFLLPNVLDRIDFFTFGHTELFHSSHARESLEYAVGVSLFAGALRIPVPTSEGRYDVAYRSYDSCLHAPLARAVTRPPFFVRTPSASIRILPRSEVESKSHPWLSLNRAETSQLAQDPRSQLMDWQTREEQDVYENPLNLQVADYNYQRSASASVMTCAQHQFNQRPLSAGTTTTNSAATSTSKTTKVEHPRQRVGGDRNGAASSYPSSSSSSISAMYNLNDANSYHYLPEVGLWIEVEVSFDIASKDDTISVVDSLSHELVCLVKPAESDATFAASVDQADSDRVKFVDDANNSRRLRDDTIICVCRLDGKEIRPLRGCGVYAEYHSARLGTTLNRIGPFDLDDPQWALQLRTATPSILPAYQLPSLVLDAFCEVPVDAPLTFRIGLPPAHRLRKLRRSSDAGAMFGGAGGRICSSTSSSSCSSSYAQHQHDNRGRTSGTSTTAATDGSRGGGGGVVVEETLVPPRTRPQTPSFPHPAGLATGEETATPLQPDCHHPLVAVKEATTCVTPLPGPSQIESTNTGKVPSRPQSALALSDTPEQQLQRRSAFSPVPPLLSRHPHPSSASQSNSLLQQQQQQQREEVEESAKDDNRGASPSSTHRCHQSTYAIVAADTDQKSRDRSVISPSNDDELPRLRPPRPGSAGLPIPQHLPPRRRPPSAAPNKSIEKVGHAHLENDNNNHNNNNNITNRSVLVHQGDDDDNEDDDDDEDDPGERTCSPSSLEAKQHQTQRRPPRPSSSSRAFVASVEDGEQRERKHQHRQQSSADKPCLSSKLVVAPLSIQQGWDLLDYLVVTVHRLSDNDSLSNPVWSCTPTGDADEWCSLFPGLPGASYVRPIPSGSSALTNSRHLRLEFPPLKRPGRYVVRASIVLPTLPAVALSKNHHTEYMFHASYSKTAASPTRILNLHEMAGHLLRAPFTLRVLCESTFRVTAADHHLTNYDQQLQRTVLDYMKQARQEQRLPVFPYGNLEPKCLGEIPLALCTDLRRGENRSSDVGTTRQPMMPMTMMKMIEGGSASSGKHEKYLPSSLALPSSVARKRAVPKKSLVFQDQNDKDDDAEEGEGDQQTRDGIDSTSPPFSRSHAESPAAANPHRDSKLSSLITTTNREPENEQQQQQQREENAKPSTRPSFSSAAATSLYSRSSMFEPPFTTLIPFSQGLVHGFLTSPKKLTTNDCIVITSHIADATQYKASKEDVIAIVDDEWQVVTSHRLLLDGSSRRPNDYQLCTVSLAPAPEPGQYFAVYFSVALGVGVLGFGPITVEAAATYSPARLTDADFGDTDAASEIQVGDSNGSSRSDAISLLAQHALRSYFAKSASNPLPVALHERMMFLKRQAENEANEIRKALDDSDKAQEYYESPLRSSVGRQLVRASSRNSQVVASPSNQHQLPFDADTIIKTASATTARSRMDNAICSLCAHDHHVPRTGLLRALLIGCDYRSSANSAFVATGGKSCCGSRDVDLLHNALKTAWGDATSGLDVAVLKDPSSFVSPVCSTSSAPTAQNIRRSLLEIIKKARLGDAVLLYFSGFGAILQGRGSTDPLRQVIVPSDVDWTAHRLIDLREIDAFARRAAAKVGPTGSVSIVIDCGFERGVFDEMDYVSSVVKGNATRNLKGPYVSKHEVKASEPAINNYSTPGKQQLQPPQSALLPLAASSLSPAFSPIAQDNHGSNTNNNTAVAAAPHHPFATSTTTTMAMTMTSRSPRPPSAGHLLAQQQLARKTPLRGAPFSPAVYREAKERLLQERAAEVQRRVDEAEEELFRTGQIRSGRVRLAVPTSCIDKDGNVDDGDDYAKIQHREVKSSPTSTSTMALLSSPSSSARKSKITTREYYYSFFHPLPVLLEASGGRVECDEQSKTHTATLRQRALAHIPLGARWKSLAVPVHLRGGVCDYASVTRRFDARDFQELPCAKFRAGGTVSLSTLLPSSFVIGNNSSTQDHHNHHHAPCDVAPIAIYFAGRRAVWQRPVSFPGRWLDGPAEDGADEMCSVFQAALSDALQSWRMSALRHPTADNSRVGDPPSGLTVKELEAWETAFMLAQPDRLRDFDSIARAPTWAELHKWIRRKLWSSPFRSQKPQLFVSHPRMLESDCGFFPVECVYASTMVTK